MNLNLAEYLKLKSMEPGSEEAVFVGCTCKQEDSKGSKDSDQATITIDPYCPFHWHIATQAQIIRLIKKSTETDKFNTALKFGYVVLAIGMTAVVLIKF
jgi:hypothetical protein